MRGAVVVFGLALVLVGAALWYVPLTSASSSSPVPLGDAYVFGVPSSWTVSSVPFKASWTSDSETNITIYSCGTNSGCPTQLNGTVVAHGSGVSGSMSWTSKWGHYFLLVPDATTNVTVSYLEPVLGGLAGIGVLGAGVLVVVAGVGAGTKPKPNPVREKSS